MSVYAQMSSELTAVDKEILDVLQGGRGTRGYIIDQTGRSRNQVGNRLSLLEARGYINRVHDPTALYELASDPRQ